MIFKLKYGIALIFLYFIPLYSFSASVSNEFFFIENQIDNEYFITPVRLDPRFSGSNLFTKYAVRQDSLGYIGRNRGGISSNRYVDIWIENSIISAPFIGNRCRNSSSGCPRSSYWSGDIRKNGVYKIRQENTSGESGYFRPVLSDSFYEYIKNIDLSLSLTLNIKGCEARSSDVDYNLEKGETCESTGGNVILNDEFTITKIGNVTLKSNNALQEIFIDSEGNAVIGLGNDFCKIGNVNGNSGLICSIVSYELKQDVDLNTLFLGLKLNPNYFTSSQGLNNIMIGDGNTNWYNYTATTSRPNVRYNYILKPGNNNVYLFMSKTFLKNLITNNIDLNYSQDFFTLAFYNSVTPQSGYYEFTPSNKLIIKPRNYGISIISSDYSSAPKLSGKMGESPLKFSYIVTTSAFRQADSITVEVNGDHKTIKNQSYCIFKPSNDAYEVPFPAYLSYKNNQGSNVTKRAACDSNKISISDALWTETTWDEPYQKEGFFYRTNLDLIFPMDDFESYWSIDGNDWIGSVTGSGEIKVEATWTGPDVQ
ncbi:fimbrial protein [Proteus mirabilis]|uniref:fimbrial protein n=1 Tax=Proteus mirabilis TaxID=584 RepID=UPI002DB95531|nr:fimbrial protein [Proteus mirabilis]MEC3991930.1 fimbrial protein [Proteus mirabilis]MEC4040684.1 fimbrial protein [Proteus mirabilis]MEC4099070.1 fimbrial protein [Proteus mirabilis]